MLILVAISIATLTGENGILAKANTAKTQTEIEEAKEQARLDIATYIAEKVEKGQSTKLNDSIIQSILTGKDYVKAEEGQPGETSFKTAKSGYEIPYSDLYKGSTSGGEETGDKPLIPSGFYEVGGTIEEGFVISDNATDKEKGVDAELVGNQFVWVPVPDITKFGPIEGYSYGKLDSKVDSCLEPFEDGYEGEDTDYTNMYNSVRDNRGFYIGRYEVGKDESEKVVIKKGVDVYNNISWGTLEIGAMGEARKFARNNGYTNVTSTLVYGVQWDATMQFMDNKYIEGACEPDSYVRNSGEKGYDGDTKPTKTGYYAYKNIYDMAGNVLEWTMEYCTGDNFVTGRVLRGGGCLLECSKYPASNRMLISPATPQDQGFRVALYL